MPQLISYINVFMRFDQKKGEHDNYLISLKKHIQHNIYLYDFIIVGHIGMCFHFFVCDLVSHGC